MDRSYLELCNFTPSIYKIEPDLRSMSDAEREQHFLNHGIEEGRFYNTITSRRSFVDYINKKGKMLEIGPLDNPQLDYQSPNYHSIDVFDKETLQKNYGSHAHIIKENILEPTYVIGDNDYSVIKEKFNCVFASHNIEHMPCVVTYLRNLEGLLAEDGTINLIVPDTRYCFDHYKNHTTIYDVLELYHAKPWRPRLSDVLRMRIQSTHNDSSLHWNTTNHGVERTETELPRDYSAILEEYNTGVYVDAHVSHFTPLSLLSIIKMLNELGLTGLKVHKMFHTLRGAIEFYVILKKDK